MQIKYIMPSLGVSPVRIDAIALQSLASQILFYRQLGRNDPIDKNIYNK